MTGGLTVERETDGAEGLQRIEGRLERCWWALVAVLLIASLFGAVGKGWLSSTLITSADNRLDVQYEWLTRYRSTVLLKLLIKDPAARAERRCVFSREFLEGLTPETFTPLPSGASVAGGDVTYTFAVPEKSQTDTLIFRFEADKWGMREGTVACDGSAPVTLWMTILP